MGTIRAGDADAPLPRFAVTAAVRQVQGDVAAIPLYAGQGVGAVDEVRPAHEVVHELAEDDAHLLAARGNERSS